MSYNKDTNMYEGYIYLITNNINGKKYVGQTIRTVEDRYKAHLNKVKHNNDNQYLYAAMNKYNIENFSIKQLEKVVCKDKKSLVSKLNEKEIYYISELNTRKPNGYNMTDGGVLLPNVFEKKPVCNYDLERNFVMEFESISDGARYYNLNISDISSCCKREKLNMVGGFIWRFKGDDYDVKTIILNTKVICQYDLDGTYIARYNGETEAKKATGINNIGQCCRGKYSHAGYFVWRFLGDDFNKYRLPNFKKVFMYDLELNHIKTFMTTKEASIYSGLSVQEVIRACSDHEVKNNYIWSFENNSEAVKIPKKIKYFKEKYNRIYMYDIYGNLVNNFVNVDCIPDEIGVSKADVLNICRGKYLCYKTKYIFSFDSNFFNNYLYINKFDKDMHYIKTYNTIGALLDDGYDYKTVINGCKNNKIFYGCYWKMDSARKSA